MLFSSSSLAAAVARPGLLLVCLSSSISLSSAAPEPQKPAKEAPQPPRSAAAAKAPSPVSAKTADSLFRRGSFAAAARAYEARLKTPGVSSAEKPALRLQLARSLALAGEWDKAVSYSHELMRGAEGTEREPVVAGWLMELYLRIPHWTLRQGRRLRRVGRRAGAADQRRADYRKAVTYGEQAWRAALKLPAGDLSAEFRSRLAVDLAALFYLSRPAGSQAPEGEAIPSGDYSTDWSVEQKIDRLLAAAADSDHEARLQQAIWRLERGGELPALPAAGTEEPARPLKLLALVHGVAAVRRGDRSGAQAAWKTLEGDAELASLARALLDAGREPRFSVQPGSGADHSRVRLERKPDAPVRWSARPVRLRELLKLPQFTLNPQFDPADLAGWLNSPARLAQFVEASAADWESGAGEQETAVPVAAPGVYLLTASRETATYAQILVRSRLRLALCASGAMLRASLEGAPAGAAAPGILIRESYTDPSGARRISAITRTPDAAGDASKPLAPLSRGGGSAIAIAWAGEEIAVAGPVALPSLQLLPLSPARAIVTPSSYTSAGAEVTGAVRPVGGALPTTILLLNAAGKKLASAPLARAGSGATFRLKIPAGTAAGAVYLELKSEGSRRRQRLILCDVPPAPAAPPAAWRISTQSQVVEPGAGLVIRAEGEGLPYSGYTLPVAVRRLGGGFLDGVVLRRGPGGYEGAWTAPAAGWYEFRALAPGGRAADAALLLRAGKAEPSPATSGLPLLLSDSAAAGSAVPLAETPAPGGRFYWLSQAGHAFPAAPGEDAGSLLAPAAPGLYHLAAAGAEEGRLRVNPSALRVGSGESGGLLPPEDRSAGAQLRVPAEQIWLLQPALSRPAAPVTAGMALSPAAFHGANYGGSGTERGSRRFRSGAGSLDPEFLIRSARELGLPGSILELSIDIDPPASAEEAGNEQISPGAPGLQEGSCGSGEVTLPSAPGFCRLIELLPGASEKSYRVWGSAALQFLLPDRIKSGEPFQLSLAASGIPAGALPPLALVPEPPVVLLDASVAAPSGGPGIPLQPSRVQSRPDGATLFIWRLVAPAAGRLKLRAIMAAPGQDYEAVAEAAVE